MMEAKSKTAVIPAGGTLPVELTKDGRLLNNVVAVKEGVAGVLSFRCKVIHGQYETPEAPNSIDISVRKSISFNGAALEGIEISNAGASAVKVAITQSAG